MLFSKITQPPCKTWNSGSDRNIIIIAKAAVTSFQDYARNTRTLKETTKKRIDKTCCYKNREIKIKNPFTPILQFLNDENQTERSINVIEI